MSGMKKEFGILFKKYRLHSEFESLAELSDELLQWNVVYDQSIFSRWQRGERIPTDRKILLTLINVFIERGGMTTLQDANTFLDSAGQGYLTNEEIQVLPKHIFACAPFYAPQEVAHFIEREEYEDDILQSLQDYKTILLYGQPGIGKTSLAIRIAHLLRNQFPDGVLWYRLDTSSPAQILASIAYTFGENITHIQDVHIQSSLVRSLLSYKKILIIFDNAEKDSRFDLLLPSAPNVSVLITSQYRDIENIHVQNGLPVSVFNLHESLQLFQKVLGEKYVKKHQPILLKISKHVGYLPLALSILAKQLYKTGKTPLQLFHLLEKERVTLSSFTYENKNLQATLNLSMESLHPEIKRVFFSLGVFKGMDFSLPAVAFINNIPQYKAQECLEELVAHSLIEQSVKMRYRLQPLIKQFIQLQGHSSRLYQKAADYYAAFLEKENRHGLQLYSIRMESDTILGVFQECYKQKYWRQTVNLGRQLSLLLIYTERWFESGCFLDKVYDAANQLGDDHAKGLCCVDACCIFHFRKGDIDSLERYAREGIAIGRRLQDEYIIAFGEQSLARVYAAKRQYPEALSLLEKSLKYFQQTKDYRCIANNFIFTSEAYLASYEVCKAKEYLYKALDVLKRAKGLFLTVEKPRVYTRLGAAYILEQRFEEAKNYFEKSIEAEEKGGTKLDVGIWNLIGLGIVYECTGQDDKAKYYFETARKEAIYFGMDKHFGVKASPLFPLIKAVLGKSKFNLFG